MWKITPGQTEQQKASKKESVSSPSWPVRHRRTTCFVVAGTRFDASVLNSSQEHFWYETNQGVKKFADRLTFGCNIIFIYLLSANVR